MRELYGLLSLLDPVKFGDVDGFLAKYGDERGAMTPDQVRALQADMKPILLRRMKGEGARPVGGGGLDPAGWCHVVPQVPPTVPPCRTLTLPARGCLVSRMHIS